MDPAPFTLPYPVKVTLDLSFPDGMPVQEVARKAPDEGLTMAWMGHDGVLLRDESRAYVKIAITPDGKVAGRLPIEGEDAAELDRRLWFTFRGVREQVQTKLTIGGELRAVVESLRPLAPIGLPHLTSQFRPDLGSLRMYHLIGGGVIGFEVDALGAITAASLLPPKVGQGAVITLEAQDRDSPLAWDEPVAAATVRAGLDAVIARGADPLGLRELDLAGDLIEITGRTDAGTRRYRFQLGGTR